MNSHSLQTWNKMPKYERKIAVVNAIKSIVSNRKELDIRKTNRWNSNRNATYLKFCIFISNDSIRSVLLDSIEVAMFVHCWIEWFVDNNNCVFGKYKKRFGATTFIYVHVDNWLLCNDSLFDNKYGSHKWISITVFFILSLSLRRLYCKIWNTGDNG